ncbi:hypothetical protein DEO72_LG6g368 [Vigna unguiculata]|uniref:Uncharacterized protein n=1 Tax=Vigna unguiculata TaxID=3917 RepID=A0A4D6M4I4_VIGUN|nr:hypothetical protein DEO72_LG6g368 [Vigna unguiculata]
MSVIQKHTHSLQELNPEKESWNIIVRVVRLWFVEDYTKGKIHFPWKLLFKTKRMWDSTEEESKVNKRTNQISSDSIVEDLLIKFTEESNDVETLSDHLNNIVSSHVPAKESLKLMS